VKRVGDLWRMNTQHEYVKGEEGLTSWTPRGVSLVHDFISARKRRERLAEIEATKAFFIPSSLKVETGLGITNESADSDAILRKYLTFWKVTQDPVQILLRNANTEPPSNGVAETHISDPSRLVAAISLVPRSPTILKGGYLLVPSLDSTRWIRRFVELRQPYLHLHSVPDGEEVGIVNLRNSRIDHQPQIAKLLRQDNKGRERKETVFAIYGTDNTWLFAARNEQEKVEWIFKIDQAYFGNGSRSPSPSEGEETND
jgi:kinesin family protein 1